jgi:hypothetical protein
MGFAHSCLLLKVPAALPPAALPPHRFLGTGCQGGKRSDDDDCHSATEKVVNFHAATSSYVLHTRRAFPASIISDISSDFNGQTGDDDVSFEGTW